MGYIFDGRRGAARAVVAAVVLIGSAPVVTEGAAAEDGTDAGPSARGPWKRLELSVSGYALSNGATLRIDSGDGTRGDPLDLERQLKVDKTLIRARIDGRARLGRRHTFQAAYYDGSRGGTARLSEDLVIGDQTFAVDASLETDISLQVFKFSYAYSFIANEKWDVAASVGVHALDLGASFFGQARIDEFSVEAMLETKKTFAPLPVIGGRISYALSPKWRFRGEVDWFRLRVGNISGSLIDVLAGLDFDITRNFGLTARFNYVNIGVNSRDLGFPGRIGYRYSAALLGGRIFF